MVLSFTASLAPQEESLELVCKTIPTCGSGREDGPPDVTDVIDAILQERRVEVRRSLASAFTPLRRAIRCPTPASCRAELVIHVR